MACVAFGCKNKSGAKKLPPGITFHKFPAEIGQKQRWILAVRRKNWQPSSYSRLCSVHFSEDQIDRTSLVRVRLREKAVPNVFPGIPNYLQNVTKKRKSPTKRVLKIVEEYQPSPVEQQLKRELERAEENLQNCKKKIHELEQVELRHKKKIQSLKCMLNELINKNLIDDTIEILRKTSEVNKEFLL